MKERKSYKGTLNGIYGIWTDHMPEGLELREEITFYVPDEGKIFVKDGEYYDCVVIEGDVKIEDYQEIADPREPEDFEDSDEVSPGE